MADDPRRAVAVLVDVDGSAPLPLGSRLVVHADGQFEGAVSGGCLEAVLIAEARALLAEGGGPSVHRFGPEERLGAVPGLTVLVAEAHLGRDGRSTRQVVEDAADAGLPATHATVVDGPHRGTTIAWSAGHITTRLSEAAVPQRLVDDLRAVADGRDVFVRRYSEDLGCGGTARVLLEGRGRPQRLILVGAGDFATALSAAAAPLGWVVLLTDHRPAFLSAAGGDPSLAGHPGEVLRRLGAGARDAVVVLSHIPHIDAPSIQAAFELGAGYVGAIGSRRTAADRRRRLLDCGCGASTVERLRSPCGSGPRQCDAGGAQWRSSPRSSPSSTDGRAGRLCVPTPASPHERKEVRGGRRLSDRRDDDAEDDVGSGSAGGISR